MILIQIKEAKGFFYFASTISLIAVLSSPSIEMSWNAGVQTKFLPLGATKPRAINQAIKAIAIARGFVAPSGKNLICIPAFTDIVIEGEERTAIKLIVEAR